MNKDSELVEGGGGVESCNFLQVDTTAIEENEKSKEVEKMKTAFEKANGVTMEKFMETLAPRPSCDKCYGRGFTGWKAPIINWKDMPKGQQQKKPARERHAMKGEKVTCSCVINQYLKAIYASYESKEETNS